MFCPQCGREYAQQVNFCSHCGSAMFRPASPAKKLARSKRDKKIAGVCAGFADYLDLDVTLVRMIWLMLAFLGGWGLIAYLVAWIIMPEEPEAATASGTVPATAPQSATNA